MGYHKILQPLFVIETEFRALEEHDAGHLFSTSSVFLWELFLLFFFLNFYFVKDLEILHEVRTSNMLAESSF